MRILLVHNSYQQPGGEDEVFRTERRLLEERGHRVFAYTVSNDLIDDLGSLDVARKTLWNGDSVRALRGIVRETRPEIAHFHNTFPLVSPAAYYAVRREGVAVVQTLHNYRLVCSKAQLFRDGRPCEDCLGKTLGWPGVVHACYREDRLATATVVAMLALHSGLRTWERQVDRYIALSRFARDKFIQGGLPGEKIVVKPNFLHPDPGPGPGGRDSALFVGRLSEEKGVRTLLRAWRHVSGPVRLTIVGDGPLADLVRDATRSDDRIRWLGRQPREKVDELMGEASCLIFPSEWYETFGLVVIEAMARGTPVLGSRLGVVPDLVDEGRTGLLFEPGDPVDLSVRLERIRSEGPGMRGAAREAFEKGYTAERNYEALLHIYEEARAGSSTHSQPSSS